MVNKYDLIDYITLKLTLSSKKMEGFMLCRLYQCGFKVYRVMNYFLLFHLKIPGDKGWLLFDILSCPILIDY